MIDGVMPPLKRRSWGMVASSTSRASWGAIPRPFDRDRRNWKRGTTWTPDVSEKKGWPQTVDRHLPDPRGELPEGALRPHRRRSDASRRQVDEPVAAGDRQATHRDGDAGQSEYRVLVAPQARIPQAESSEEEDDGPPQSQPQRQFENIARLKKEYLKAGLPVISMDTKKKELLGNFYRDGTIDTQETIETNDHDFGSAGAGVVIPHSLYDVGENKGFIHLNTSHDTSELACDSLAAWWDQQGRADYPQAQKLLVLCDGGGSNSATMYLFKEDLQKLASRLGIEIRVAHYPPYCSKYNPIEHRLFPHLTRACRGVIFHTLETVRYYMAKAETTTGMRVKVSILDKVYATGRKCAAGFKKAMKIVFDSFLPKWNYTAVPEPV